MKWTNRVGRCLGFGTTLAILAAGGAGCLSRPVGTGQPTTKVNFTAAVAQAQIDKVDLLFAIDNSKSMDDKQAILAEAVPRLLDGLLKPDCVDSTGAAVGGNRADPSGNEQNNYGCPSGSTAAFKPVTDLHIGVVSSSLGGMGSTSCPDSDASHYYNDHGHLVSRGSTNNASFLAWYPSAANTDKGRHPEPPVPAIGDAAQLSEAFKSIVVGTGQTGCGLEAQLESVYRFLIQPDPWKEVKKNGNIADLGQGTDNIDTDLLKQRADFLRPDSLVAVIMLTDEDDSSSDPLALGGQGFAFMGPAPMPKGTTACDKDPTSDACDSCAYPKNSGDANCKNGGSYTASEDDLNARFFHMKKRYGVDPQYPLQRYIDGFTKSQVPDRSTEHVLSGGRPGNYEGKPKCTNPLFAAKLPVPGKDDYCDLPVGARSSSLVYFAIIGGAPTDLVKFNADDSTEAEKGWQSLLGKDPEKYDFTGISPYMVQSKEPRSGLAGDAPLGDNGDTTKPVGRDYQTYGHDLQYACTFPLPTPRDATEGSDCLTTVGDKQLTPPLCDGNGKQVRAKAYPTIREFRVAKGLGKQGIIASLCPEQLDNPNAENYGYNPAVQKIVDRLKAALSQQCLPQQLARDADNEVPCLVLVKLSEKGKKCTDAGLKDPPKEIADTFRDQEKAAKRDATLPICEIPQKAIPKGESCKTDKDKVWCYVENGDGKNPAGNCPQALLFSQGTSDLGSTATFSLQCIQQFSSGGSSSAKSDAGE